MAAGLFPPQPVKTNRPETTSNTAQNKLVFFTLFPSFLDVYLKLQVNTCLFEKNILKALEPLPNKGDGNVKVGVVLPTLSNPYYVTKLNEAAAAEAGAKITAHMSTNFIEQGHLAGAYISEKIKASGAKTAKVAVIEGLAGAYQGEARRDGAVAAFKEAGMDVVSIQTGDWDRQKAYNIANNLLQSNPDLRGIFCANDTMALGVVEALKVAGKKNQVFVTGIDFLDEARQSLKAGELNASVAMAPYIRGKGTLTLVLKVLQKHDISQQNYWSPLALITQENVNEYDDWK